MTSSTSMNGAMIRLGRDLEVPVDLATEAVAVLGRRGKGKTNTAGVIVEDLVQLGVPVCVVDTVGVWWGLRSSKSGKGPGLPVVVFGGLHADVPLEETAGKVIAQVIVDRRIPAVIDTSALKSKSAARRFLTDFVTEVYHRNRQPMHVVFDEADELAPQNPRAEGARLLGAMEDFVRRGRARGLGCTLVTQRPAVLNKDVLTQIEVLITHGLTGPRDVAAIDEWVRLHADQAEALRVKKTLASLPVGRAWVWSPSWLGILQQVDVRARKTFDSSATPKVGVTVETPQARAKIDLEALGAEITAAIEKAAAEDPRHLRKQIADLQRQLTARPPEPVTVQVPVEVPVEVPTLSAEDRRRLDETRDLLTRVQAQLADLPAVLSTAAELLAGIEAKATPDRGVMPATQSRRHSITAPAPVPPATTAAPALRAGSQRMTSPEGVRVDESTEQVHTEQRADVSASGLGRAERLILTALATYGPRSHSQIALLTGYSSKGGGFANALGRLRSAGRIVGGRDRIEITGQGVEDLGPYDPLPEGPALVEHWLSRLGKAERAILRELVDVWPATLTNEEIAARAGYTASGGGFANALGRLRTLEVIFGGRTANSAADELGHAARGAR